MSKVLKNAATYLSNSLVEELKPELTGRLLAYINPDMTGDGKTNYEYTEITSLTAASIQMNLPSGTGEKDALTFTSGIIQVPVIFKEFQMQMSDILAWDNRRVAPGQTNSLRSLTATAASRVVAERENDMIYNGWNPTGGSGTEKIPGFLSAAGNTVEGGSIATVSNMYKWVAKAIGELNDANVKGDNDAYNLVISSQLLAALKGNIRDGAVYAEVKEIQENLLGPGGRIITATQMKGKGGTVSGNATDAALVTPVDSRRKYFEFLNPKVPTITFANPKYDDLSPVEGICYELFRPHYLRLKSGTTDAIAKITKLTY